MQFNKCILSGNLTGEPEFVTTKGGNEVSNFRIANNRGPKDNRTTNFLNVSAWGHCAKNCADYLGKGDMVLVEGTLRTESYVGNDGTNKLRVWIDANNVQFIHTKKSHLDESTQPASVSDPEETKDSELSEVPF